MQKWWNWLKLFIPSFSSPQRWTGTITYVTNVNLNKDNHLVMVTRTMEVKNGLIVEGTS